MRFCAIMNGFQSDIFLFRLAATIQPGNYGFHFANDMESACLTKSVGQQEHRQGKRALADPNIGNPSPALLSHPQPLFFWDGPYETI